MVFLLASFYEFTLFLKIVLWIAVPLILVSFTVTTILHYRQKKKNALKAANDPEHPQSEIVDISLVSRLQKEVVHYKRRIRELQHALSFAKEVIPPSSIDSRVAALQEEVAILRNDPDPALDLAVSTDFVPLGYAAQGPVPEGSSDSTELSPDSATPPSTAYLQDLVNEQKTHVLFLQQQLEARIKAFHDLEYQFRDKAALLEKMTLSYEHVKHQLDDAETVAATNKAENEALQLQLGRLETSLKELQERHNKSLRMLDTTQARSAMPGIVKETLDS